jgi:hypothetical protein
MIDDKEALKCAIARSKFPVGHFHTAELEDDSDPNSLVVIRNREGFPVAWMSVAAFEALNLVLRNM